MLNKVLVFESDPVFAGELQREFEKLGAKVSVVDDGHLGLQQAANDPPDLILLAIELPRMNGFSVCNKLKKDPLLKDVPLIILSSESSSETFDQHKKLRTRAEDYLHKPVAFGELLERVRRFVPVLSRPSQLPGQADGAIVIDDEIEVGADYFLEDDDDADDAGPPPPRATPALALATPSAVSPLMTPPPLPPIVQTEAYAATPARSPELDTDLDAFAETAFGRLTQGVAARAPAPAGAMQNGTGEGDGNSRGAAAAASLASRSSRPPPVGLDVLEHERIKNELAVARERLDTTERELDEAVREVGRLRLDATDGARQGREIDELRSKLAAAAKSGGSSNRDFLDLREALNRKDKEILSFREQISRRDRENVEAQERALALERGRADLEDRLLGVERELAELRDRLEVTLADRDAARKANEDARTRVDKLRTEAEARERHVSELRAKQVDERLATEAKLGAVRAEADQVLANERAEHARALDFAEQRRGADLEAARRERDAALVDAQKQGDKQRHDALAEQLAQLREEHDVNVSGLRRGHVQDLERARFDATAHEESVLAALRSDHEGALKAAAEERDARVAAAEGRAAREIGHALDRVTQVEGERDGLRRDLQAAAEDRRSFEDQADSRIASLERDLQGARDELAAVKEQLAREVELAGQRREKAEADRQSLERAKDALAIALSRIEETETAGNGAR